MRQTYRHFSRSLIVALLSSMAFSCSLESKRGDAQPKADLEPIKPIPEQTIVEEETTVDVAGPEVLDSKKIPKVGIILGPGGLKAYAHLGVLQALVKARIPIDSIVGIGWGAPVAALYAANAQVFDAEWKMFKMDPSQLPRTGLLTKSIKPGSVNALDKFLDENFSQVELETSKIPFACPIRSVFNDDVRWVQRGKANTVLRPCLAALPYFVPYERQYAATTAVDDAAIKLRELGAEIVIFVNVLKQGAITPKDKVEAEVTTHVMWSEIRHSLNKQSIRVNDVIGINSRDHSLISADSLREFLRQGRQAGKSAAQDLIEKYGF